MSATVFEITAISCNFLKLCGFCVCSVFAVTPPIDLLMFFTGIHTNHAFANEILDFCALAPPSYYKKATSAT